MSTIDRTVELKLPNNPGHALHYTVKSIVGCEKELTNHNLILTVASLAASPLSISDAYALLLVIICLFIGFVKEIFNHAV